MAKNSLLPTVDNDAIRELINKDERRNTVRCLMEDVKGAWDEFELRQRQLAAVEADQTDWMRDANLATARDMKQQAQATLESALDNVEKTLFQGT